MIRLFTNVGLVFIAFFIMVLVPAESVAAEGENNAKCSAGSSNFLGLPTWHTYLDKDDQCNVQPERYSDGSVHLGLTIGAVLLAVIEILLRVAGIVAVGAIIYGGIAYSISQGAPDKTAAARTIITNGLIGLVIASLAVALVGLVSGVVTGYQAPSKTIALSDGDSSLLNGGQK